MAGRRTGRLGPGKPEGTNRAPGMWREGKTTWQSQTGYSSTSAPTRTRYRRGPTTTWSRTSRGRRGRHLRRGRDHQGQLRQGARQQGRESTRHGAWGGAAVWRARRHPVPARDHRHRTGRRGGRRGGRPYLAWHVPLRRQGVRGAHRPGPGCPRDRRREQASGGHRQGGIEVREAGGQGAEREPEGRRQGRAGSRHGSQLPAGRAALRRVARHRNTPAWAIIFPPPPCALALLARRRRACWAALRRPGNRGQATGRCGGARRRGWVRAAC